MPARPEPPSSPAAGSARGPIDRAAAFRRSPAFHHQALRFVANGVLVAAFHVALGLGLAGPLGLPIQAAIPVAYVASLVLNYALQRFFVFAHTEHFALGARAQFVRYLAVAALQYGLIAAATAALPGPLGVRQEAVYAAAVLLTPLVTFAALRAVVFHD